MSMFAELKRRKVFKVGAAYLVVGWLLIQVAATIGPQFNLPDWAPRLITFLILLGFPIALVMAWIFDVTPDGVKLDATVSGSKRLFAAAAVIAAMVLGWYWHGVTGKEKPTAVASTPAPEVASQKSIAVLAFTDLSPKHDQDYFSDGIAEELLNALAQVKDLKVAGRTSSFYYKGRNEDLRSIGKALGVANVLEGSVRTQGEKVRITAQLIRSEDGFHLWSETYDGDLKDVFALQERIARSITEKLQVVLSGKQAERLVNTGTENPEAYALYLQATGTFNRRDGEHFPDAIAQLTDAIRLDPNFARAHSRLAAIHAVAPIYVPSATFASSSELAETQLNVAMKLEPGLAEPYAVLGYLRIQQRRQVEAELAFGRALELDPDDVTSIFWHGIALVGAGYTKLGIAEFDRVLLIDPLLPNGLNWRGAQYAYSGDMANAERLLRRAQDVGMASAGWGLAIVADSRGQKLEAIEQLTSFLRNIMPGFPPGELEILARGAYGDATARENALALINRYLDSKPASLSSGILYVLLKLGEPARVLTLAPERLSGNDGIYMTLLWSPGGREARATPEFQTFIHRFGLVELWDKFGPPDLCRKGDNGDYVCE